MPDESSSHNVQAAARHEFDDLEDMETRVRPTKREEVWDTAPTKVRPSIHRQLIARPKAAAANFDDVVEDLRAAAAGRHSIVDELPSSELLPPDPDDVVEVDVGELMVDRPVVRREVWNVHRAAGRSPQVTMLIQPRAQRRFVMVAALAMLAGAILAIGAAVIAWRVTGIF